MLRHLQKELDKIKKRVLSLGALVEDRVHKVSRVIEKRDLFEAGQIIKLDYEVDEKEVEIEEECLKVLALHQPVAVDLRFLIAVIKINNDLERISDETVNIAQRVTSIAKQQNISDFRYDYTAMTEKVASMLRMSLDALVNMDADIAFKVCLMDDDVDDFHHDAYDQIKSVMKEHPADIRHLLNLFLISRHLERVGDHATNIAEEVIYMIEGEIVRHTDY
jgi:phosphate transport system protein